MPFVHNETVTELSGGATSGRVDNDHLVPTPELTWQQFEDFTERLLAAHRFCSDNVVHVTRVERWGRPGDKQHGIDFEGSFSDGSSAAWQCKQQKKLTPAQVDSVVSKCTFQADRYFLTFSGQASPAARTRINKYDNWELLDQRGLQRLLEDLPLPQRRHVLDETWGSAVRKRLLHSPGEDAFLRPVDAAAARSNPARILSDCGPLIGRESELQELVNGIRQASPDVVILSGPGGRGKSRLLLEALTTVQESRPEVPVLYLSPGRRLDPDALHELPHAPAVIAVDDAHHTLTSIPLILTYMQQVAGTQLIFAIRDTHSDGLRSALAAAGFKKPRTTALGPMTRVNAYKLVNSLAAGLELNFPLTSHLVEQATHSPHIAVLALNLARSGQLAGPLPLSENLRQEVLSRYQEVQTEAIGHFSTALIHRTLATYTALGPFDADTHTAATEELASFCGQTTIEHLRLLEQLEIRGVLLRNSSGVRVVPDVLADQILEHEAIVAGYDTSFVAELWNRFNTEAFPRLLNTLAELDWRLRHQGLPTVLDPIWSELCVEVLQTDLDGTSNALDKLQSLARNQPRRVVELLDSVRGRLEKNSIAIDSVAGPRHLTSGRLDRQTRERFGLEPITNQEIEDLLAKLYGLCAHADSAYLEAALDGLWAIRCRRGPRDRASSEITTAATAIANLGTITDSSIAPRIVERVRTWSLESAAPDYADPTFPLKPLLVKEGTRSVQTKSNELSLSSYQLPAEALRPIRDSAREVLRQVAEHPSLLRVGPALELLEAALRQPSGFFGQIVPREAVLAWENDDLATIEILGEIADVTPSPVVRRKVREIVSWSAERATSVGVRYAALSLVTRLDQAPGDDLAELLLNEYRFRIPSQRGHTLPTFQDFAQTAAQPNRCPGGDKDETDSKASDRSFDDRQHATSVLLTRTVRTLLAKDNEAHLLDQITNVAEQITQLRSTTPNLWALYRHIGTSYPHQLTEILAALGSRPPSVLDLQLDVLLNAWSQHDEPALLEWLTEASTQRPALRLAIARAFDHHGWADRSGDYLAIYRSGWTDSDVDVRRVFLESSHVLVRSTPAREVPLLLAADISPNSATHVLEYASRTDGILWGATLDEPDATAIMMLGRRSGLESWAEQQLVQGIASSQPRLVLDQLDDEASHGERLPHELPGLAEAISDHPDKLAAWMLDRTSNPDVPRGQAVVALALASGISENQARSIASLLTPADTPTLTALLELLSSTETWPLRQPSLARSFLHRADQLGVVVSQHVLEAIESATQLGSIFWSNGVSDDVNNALTLATKAAQDESDPRVGAIYTRQVQSLRKGAQDMEDKYTRDTEF